MLYSKALDIHIPGLRPKDDKPLNTVAFFEISRDGERLRAIGTDGQYSIGKGGIAEFSPLPNFETIGNIGVSFELRNFVLVSQSSDSRRSITRAIPLLVPR